MNGIVGLKEFSLISLADLLLWIIGTRSKTLLKVLRINSTPASNLVRRTLALGFLLWTTPNAILKSDTSIEFNGSHWVREDV